jgi:hypothetical protein
LRKEYQGFEPSSLEFMERKKQDPALLSEKGAPAWKKKNP